MEFKKFLDDIELFLFDLDGTLYLGNQLFDFTNQLLNCLKNNNKKYVFITNNASKSIDAYIEKFKNLGIETNKNEYVTASTATVVFLKEKFPDAKLYIVGTNSFKQELINNGLNVTENLDEVDSIVLSTDTELNFEKIDNVCRLLQTKKVNYFATNPDEIIPCEYGFLPDCGALIDMLYKATKIKPQIIGKPNPIMPIIAMKENNCKPENTVVVGDRLDTDILSGINACCKTVLVFSGAANEKDLNKSRFKPDFSISSCKEILEALDC